MVYLHKISPYLQQILNLKKIKKKKLLLKWTISNMLCNPACEQCSTNVYLGKLFPLKPAYSVSPSVAKGSHFSEIHTCQVTKLSRFDPGKP